jgi:hypothetical protein
VAAAGAVDRRFATGVEAGTLGQSVQKGKMTGQTPGHTHEHAGNLARQPLSPATRRTSRPLFRGWRRQSMPVVSCSPCPVIASVFRPQQCHTSWQSRERTGGRGFSMQNGKKILASALT